MIFYSLFYMLEEFEKEHIIQNLVRVIIREDKQFGEAIIEDETGTPRTWTWNNELNIWE